VKKSATTRAGTAPRWVVVEGDGCITDQAVDMVGGRSQQYSFRGEALYFNLAPQIINTLSQPDGGIR
jgi:hypothetical protein